MHQPWVRTLQDEYANKITKENAVAYIDQTIKELEDGFPQTRMNGKENMWVLKDAASSKGEGITIHHDYQSIVSTIKAQNGPMVAMKYIENPLLVKSRKFDLRIIVALTSWNPLRAWTYEETYLKLAYDVYDEDSNDVLSHLTNGDIFKSALKEEGGRGLTDPYMTLDEFKADLLANDYGPKAWEDKIFPQIKDAVAGSFKIS